MYDYLLDILGHNTSKNGYGTRRSLLHGEAFG
jgi:hypothetical protein